MPPMVEAFAENAGVVVSSAKGKTTLEGKSGARLTLTLPVPPVRDAGVQQELCDNGVDDVGLGSVGIKYEVLVTGRAVVGGIG